MKAAILTAWMCLTAAVGSMVQTVETFCQPYPAGEKISPNPNFSSEVWLASIQDWLCRFCPHNRRFLKEHLFADIFERDLLTYRELATASILAGVGGVESMAYGHMGICLHLGITSEQLTALLNILEVNLGPVSVMPLRKVLNDLTKRNNK